MRDAIDKLFGNEIAEDDEGFGPVEQGLGSGVLRLLRPSERISPLSLDALCLVAIMLQLSLDLNLRSRQ
jgi:hypothetical protein